jgi:tRNA C32,U32 (ribose-2'-O)-methylase TrmJ
MYAREEDSEAIRTQRCLLDYIIGIGAISKYPSSQIGGAVQVWQYQLLKANSVLRV